MHPWCQRPRQSVVKDQYTEDGAKMSQGNPRLRHCISPSCSLPSFLARGFALFQAGVLPDVMHLMQPPHLREPRSFWLNMILPGIDPTSPIYRTSIVIVSYASYSSSRLPLNMV